MADDKSKRGAQDRAKISTTEQYEVDYFAKKHGLTEAEAVKIIKAAGGSREKADAAAAKR